MKIKGLSMAEKIGLVAMIGFAPILFHAIKNDPGVLQWLIMIGWWIAASLFLFGGSGD